MNEKVLGHFLRYKRLTANPAAFGILLISWIETLRSWRGMTLIRKFMVI
ncbi:hypothetical protein [Schleiferilactobacillus perolens]